MQVPHDIDQRIGHVWDCSPDLYGAYMRLRTLADMAYPDPAPFPRWVTDAALDALVNLEVMARLPADTFRLPELDAQRAEQAEQNSRAGRASGAARAAAEAKRGNGRSHRGDERSAPKDQSTGVHTMSTTDGHVRTVGTSVGGDGPAPEGRPSPTFREGMAAKGLRPDLASTNGHRRDAEATPHAPEEPGGLFPEPSESTP